MRICFVAHARSANTISWANYLADALRHDVHVVSLCASHGLSSRVTLHVLPVRGPRSLRYIQALPMIKGAVRSVAPDIVIGYRVMSYGFLAAVAGVHPLVVAAQGRVVSPPLVPLKQLLARHALRHADLVNSWSQPMTERLVEVGARPERILTCPRGIDLGLFASGKPTGERSETLLATRTMHRAYRHDIIVRALALASKTRPRLRGVFVGDGEARAELEALARELGVGGRLEFRGEVDPESLAELLRSSALYVPAVRTDGVSASVLEAMATGCFPVVTDNGANRLWLDGVNGSLVVGTDPSGFADAIVSALENEALRSSAAAANRCVVEERADIDRNMKAIESAYVALVDPGTKGRG